MSKLRDFVYAVLAGISISIGGVVYLSLDNKIAGALLFTAGLYAIVLNGLFLYTGKIGYLVTEKDKKWIRALAQAMPSSKAAATAAKIIGCSREDIYQWLLSQKGNA